MSKKVSSEVREFYGECKGLYECSKSLVRALKNVLAETKEDFQADEDLGSIIEDMAALVEGMRKISLLKNGNPAKELEAHRITLWKSRLLVEKLATAKLANDLVLVLLDSPITETALRLAHLYNELLALDICGHSRSINVFRNTCPMLLYPLRKLSMSRILQNLAMRRAEECSYRVMSGLLASPGEGGGEGSRPPSPSPPATAFAKELNERRGKIQALETLWRAEDKRARILLALSARAAPQLLGTDFVVPSRTSGKPRAKTSVRRKLIDYYQQVLWGEVGGYLEHILLWWSQNPLGSFPPSRCQNLREHLLQVKSTDLIPSLLLPSVNSLLDAMCCHLTSASWDQLFRKSLVSGGSVRKAVLKGCDLQGSPTGHLFVEMLSDLIHLNNSCEDSSLDLEELPLVEQIPILHRLDHSVHMVRLWMSAHCRNFAANWHLDEFYCTCHTDIAKCLQTLTTLQLTDHHQIPPIATVQVTVCVKMRAKLVSEIRENIDKLKRTGNECMSVLAKDCRTECLAILHMCFPGSAYWRQNGPLPDCASDYVDKYLDSVLRPVFVATQKMSLEIRQSSSAMVLRILCESWLEYVYLHRIKFSEWGAVQLLTDFGGIPSWLMERVQLPKDLLNCLISHEVLKRCEGVGRLLLRRRGESIRMSTSLYKSEGEDSSTDRMPAEMHVPNQEQWLDLRAPVTNNLCCRL